MEYEVLDNKFISIKGINHVKDSSVNLGEYRIGNNMIEGNLEIEVTYIDNYEIENIFHSKIPLQIFIDEENVKLEVKDTSINVIDNQGIELLFALIISSNEEKIKEEIKEEIEKKLEESLKERDDSFLVDREIEENIIPTKEEALIPSFADSYQTYKIVYNKFDSIYMNYQLEDIIKDEEDIVIVKMNE